MSVGGKATSILNSMNQEAGIKFSIQVLFLPYSPGVYIAFVLQDQQTIASFIQNQAASTTKQDSQQFFSELESLFPQNKFGKFIESEESKLDTSDTLSEASTPSMSKTPSVSKLNITNRLFLDINSLSKNMQALLNNYEMFVIAQVSAITPHTFNSQTDSNLGLNEGDKFFKCSVSKVDHIINFTSHILNKRDEMPMDYSFTDYKCK